MLIYFYLGIVLTLIIGPAIIGAFLHRTRHVVCLAPPGSRVSNDYQRRYRPGVVQHQQYVR